MPQQPCSSKSGASAPDNWVTKASCPLSDYDSEAPLSCMEYLTKAQDAEGFVLSIDKQFESFRQKIQQESTGPKLPRGCKKLTKAFEKPPWTAPEVTKKKPIRPKTCRSKSSVGSDVEDIPEENEEDPDGTSKEKKTPKRIPPKYPRQLSGPGQLRKKLWQYFENKQIEKTAPSIAPFAGPRDDCLNRAICRPIDEYDRFGAACQYHDDFMENLATCCGFECPKKEEACPKDAEPAGGSIGCGSCNSGPPICGGCSSVMEEPKPSPCRQGGGSVTGKKKSSPTPCSARGGGYEMNDSASSQQRGMDLAGSSTPGASVPDYMTGQGGNCFQRHAYIAQPPPFLAGVADPKPPPPDSKGDCTPCGTPGTETPRENSTDEAYYDQLLNRAKQICEGEEPTEPECIIEEDEEAKLLDHPIFGPPPRKAERGLAETFRLYKEHLSILRRRYFGAVCKYIDDVDEITPEIAAAMVITEESGLMMKAAPARLYEYLYPDQPSQPVMKISDISERVPGSVSNMVVPLVPPMFLNASEYPGLEDPAMLDSPRIIQIGPSVNLAEEPQITETKFPMDIVEVVTGTVDNGGDEEEEMMGDDDEEYAGPTDFDIKLEQALPPHFARIQLRGSQKPSWFPGYYVAMPNRMGVMVQNHMGDVLEKVWEEVQPEFVKPAGGATIIGEL